MRNWVMAAAGCLVVLTGCSGQSQNNAAGAQTQSPGGNATDAAPAAPAAPAVSEARFQQLAECSATMEALSRLYGAIASQENGARKAELEQTAAARRNAATMFESEAATAGQGLGRTAADVERIRTETHARLEQERARQPDFGDFAIWLGREADRCAALVPGAG